MNVALPGPPRVAEFSYCRVDASGVQAEWVEATVATEGQPTVVYFISAPRGCDALEESRPSAGTLAMVTGARVLSVACPTQVNGTVAASIEHGITAYVWLLGEGCDTDRTAFTHDLTDAPLVEAILAEIRIRNMPSPRWLPDGGRSAMEGDSWTTT